MIDKKNEVQNLIAAAETMGDQLATHADGPSDVGSILHTALCRWAMLKGRNDDVLSALAALNASFGDLRP